MVLTGFGFYEVEDDGERGEEAPGERPGREEEARKMLARALALAPGMNARRATDPDFEPYRDCEWFRELVAFKR
jgi:hypothetical protein